MVRPWKLRSAATITGRPGPAMRRTSLTAASLASAPELAKKTRPSATSRDKDALGQLDLALVQEQVGGVRHLGHLAADRLDDGGWACPSELTAIPAIRSRYSRPSAS
jgi:hypothetical protein